MHIVRAPIFAQPCGGVLSRICEANNDRHTCSFADPVTKKAASLHAPHAIVNRIY